MHKWFENPAVDSSVVISSRVRLARNLRGYLFPPNLSFAQAQSLVGDLVRSIINERSLLNEHLTHTELSGLGHDELSRLSERHLISSEMVNKTYRRGLISDNAENIAIMLNEEDHVRIQGIFCGDDIYGAYDIANRIDDLMSETLQFAFDPDFGYLTSCPTNTGTGLRASYMLHLPCMEYSGRLKKSADYITKAGFAVRGIHGEGSQSMGNVYQVSNHFTLGMREDETIAALKKLVAQLVEAENTLRQDFLQSWAAECEDRVHRAYGLLSRARKIGLTEAMSLLSDLRSGKAMGIEPNAITGITIYNAMICVQPYSLCEIMGDTDDARELDINRAAFLRSLI